jgi:hypothetical protein
MGFPAPVSGTFTANSQRSASFRPMAGVPFNYDLNGTWVGTVQLERSFDGGVTWNAVSKDVSGAATSHTTVMSFNRVETEGGVLYSWHVTAFTSGTINYRLSQ